MRTKCSANWKEGQDINEQYGMPAVQDSPPTAVSARPLAVIEAELDLLKQDTRQKETALLCNYIEIGRRLEEVKAQLAHGQWGEWLKKMEIAQSTANNFMRLFREYGDEQQSLFGAQAKSQTFGNLTYSKALKLLAIPDEEEREQFVAEHDVESMSVRQLEQAVRERAQALADKEAAEESRAKAEQDMTLVREQLAAAEEERDKALEEIDARQAALRAAEEKTARLSSELDELKARPVEVAVEVDQEAIDKARAEGEAAKSKELAALQEKLDKEKENARKLKADLDAAAQGRAHAESALGEAQARLAAAAQPEKPSPLTADAELAQFKLLFEQAQGLVKQMRELLLNLRTREDGAAAGKLEQALVALSEKVRRCAE